LNDIPEINLARRVLEKYNLEPPINVLELATHYAKLEAFPFSLNIDGVSLHIKVKGWQPTIILNDNRPATRKRFTLAHEIGHILIPWHIGTIVDEIDIEGTGDFLYWQLEGEANRFAAELLMPSAWLNKIMERHENPCEILSMMRQAADVSFEAALRRLLSALVPGYLYAIVHEDGLVVSSDRSHGTLMSRLERGSFVDSGAQFGPSDARWSMPFRGGVLIWWRFPHEHQLPNIIEARERREILNAILNDLDIEGPNSATMRQTINGIVANANSTISNDLRLRNLPKTPEAIYSAAMQRFESRMRDNAMLRGVVNHPEFSAYLIQRIMDFVSRPTRRRSR